MAVQPVMRFVLKEPSVWWKMRKGFSILGLMKINVFAAINALTFAQSRGQSKIKKGDTEYIV